MRAGRKLGMALVFIGFSLLCAAGGLLYYNHAESQRAQAASAQVLEALAEQIQSNLSGESVSPTEDSSDKTPAVPVQRPPVEEDACPVVQIDGVDYIGVLSFPSLELELPVMAQWSPAGLQIAPGRYAGTPAGENLVIAGHNYDAHFGQMQDLRLNDPVLFTDVNGKVYSYAVLDIEILQPTAIEDMIAGDYPLTVFTCTYGGRTRLTIRCG